MIKDEIKKTLKEALGYFDAIISCKKATLEIPQITIILPPDFTEEEKKKVRELL